MDLLRKTFWIALFVFATLCFVVLFEQGTYNFVPNVKKQIGDLKEFLVKTYQEQMHPEKKK